MPRVTRRLGTVAVLALGALVGWALLSGGVHLRRVTSGSMEPTFAVGSWIVARERPGTTAGDVERGDVAVIRYPFGSDLRAIKRVVALPGDHVRVTTDSVTVNGVAIAVEPVGDTDPRAPDATADRVVAPGHVFVLGDNSGASIDSRSFGDVPERELAGRVLVGLPAPPALFALTGALAVAAALGAALVRRTDGRGSPVRATSSRAAEPDLSRPS